MKSLVLILLASMSTCFASSALTDEEVSLYYEQGYFIKKGYLSSTEITVIDELSSSLITKSLSFINNDSIPFSDQIQIGYLQGAQLVFKKTIEAPPCIFRIPGCVDLEPKLMHTLASKKLLDTFFHLLACDDLEQIICQFHPKMPHDGVNFPRHIDKDNRQFFDPNWEDIAGNGSCAVAVFAIDPMSKENGGLFIDTGSYPLQGKEKALEVIMEPGDLLFIHPEIIHWSCENTSNKSRRTLLSGFCVFGANHRNYPGNATNNCYKKVGEDIEVRPAPWKEVSQGEF